MSNYLMRILEFQSTLPHGKRLVSLIMTTPRFCFNPRSHMGSDQQLAAQQFDYNVSIHAPTWGATHNNAHYKRRYAFQSTLPHGERLTFFAHQFDTSSFNPRSHMGSDRTFFIFLFYNELQHNFCERAECNNLYIIISTI